MRKLTGEWKQAYIATQLFLDGDKAVVVVKEDELVTYFTSFFANHPKIFNEITKNLETITKRNERRIANSQGEHYYEEIPPGPGTKESDQT